MNAYGASIVEGIEKLENNNYKINKVNANDGGKCCKLSDGGDGIKTELWLAGDLLFLAAAQGREGASPHWCIFCDLIRSQWQEKDFERGSLWNLQLICDKCVEVTANGDDMTARQIKGVSKMPMFGIEVDHCVPPILHFLIGVVNFVIENLTKELQAGMETYSDGHLKAEEEWVKATVKKDEIKEERDAFIVHDAEYIKYLRQSIESSADDGSAEMSVWEAELEFLEEEQTKLDKQWTEAKDDKTSLKKI